MAKIYYELILKDLKRIEDVPSIWQEEVQELLRKNTEIIAN